MVEEVPVLLLLRPGANADWCYTTVDGPNFDVGAYQCCVQNATLAMPKDDSELQKTLPALDLTSVKFCLHDA